MDKDLESLKHLMEALNPKNGVPCVYCGALATDKEHITPLSWIEYTLEIRACGFEIEVPKEKLVPSCHECNCIASDRIFETFKAKKEYIKEHLFKKYKKFLTYPEWTEKEIMELDGNLRKQVFIQTEIVKSIKKRLDNLKR